MLLMTLRWMDLNTEGDKDAVAKEARGRDAEALSCSYILDDMRLTNQ